MINEERGVIEVQQWRHVRRPVVRTVSGVYLLDHPCWLARAGHVVRVRIAPGDQFAGVVDECPVTQAELDHDSQPAEPSPPKEPHADIFD